MLADFDTDADGVFVEDELTVLETVLEALGELVCVPVFVPVWELVLEANPDAVFVPGSGSERVGLVETDFD